MIDEPAIRRRFGLAMVGANLAGALAVFLLLVFVVPIPGVAHPTRLKLINAAVFAPGLVLTLALTLIGQRRRWRRVTAWLGEDRQPTDAERDQALRYPLAQQRTHALLWGAAMVLFAALNAPFSGKVAAYVAIGIAIGGLVSIGLSYLLAERVLRPLTALALAGGPSDRPQLPGVATRALLAWTLGTGVLLLGIALLAIAALGQQGVSVNQIAASMLVLSVLGLVTGLALSAGLARSLAQRVEALRAATAQVAAGDFDHAVVVDDGSEVGLLQAGFNQMVAGLRERERLRDLFGRQVGEDVARQALERGVELGGEAREAAVLFVDIQGSTTLAEKRDPHEVVGLLNRFFDTVVEVVGSHDGWVNKFEGDAALCVFGTPLPNSRAPEQALAAARELGQRLAAELPEIGVGIGVSAGRVVAGNVGAASRFEYTVIGDPVNQAARLTELAKGAPGRVLASATTVERAGEEERRRWRLGDEVRLRGRETPTRVAAPG